MKVEKILCDREECKGEDATTFTLYKERKADGAGGIETWYHTFDLCPKEQTILLQRILQDLGREHQNEFLTIIKRLKIKTREH